MKYKHVWIGQLFEFDSLKFIKVRSIALKMDFAVCLDEAFKGHICDISPNDNVTFIVKITIKN